jgi:type IV pilus assembly protein PilA
MYNFRKSKKGFTLIELMVVVAIIGVLVLLGLRAYSSQKERAMNAIVKANAGTVQTMLVGYMGDSDILTTQNIIDALTADIPLEKMVNPYNSSAAVYFAEADTASDFAPKIEAHQGMVVCTLYEANNVWVNARGKYGEILMKPTDIKSLPANKY